VDVIGFLGLGGLFTAHITGNLVILAAHIVAGSDASVSLVISVPVFIVALAATPRPSFLQQAYAHERAQAAKASFATACKPRFSAIDQNDILNGPRAIDRGAPNHQIQCHQISACLGERNVPDHFPLHMRSRRARRLSVLLPEPLGG
jgi:Protein of unknown function (DUF1275)